MTVLTTECTHIHPQVCLSALTDTNLAVIWDLALVSKTRRPANRFSFRSARLFARQAQLLRTASFYQKQMSQVEKKVSAVKDIEVLALNPLPRRNAVVKSTRSTHEEKHHWKRNLIRHVCCRRPLSRARH